MNLKIPQTEQTEAAPIEGGEVFDLSALAEASRVCDWMFDQFPARDAKKVCEVGAGIGTFSERLLQAGVEDLHLIEPDPTLFAHLASRYGDSDGVTLRAESTPGSSHLSDHSLSFDFILCQNVLEHIEDDFAAMQEMGSALRPGGKLGLLVPANPALFGSLDLSFDHYRRYTKERLLSLSKASGLKVVDLRFFNLLGVLGWWVRCKMRKATLGRSSLKTFNALLKLWRPIEDRLVPNYGLSLILIAEKPS